MKDEFFNLSTEQLITLISRDHISVNSEMIILKSLIRWLNFDRPNRSTNFSSALKHIRLPLLDDEELLELNKLSIIHEIPECKEILREAIAIKRCKPVANETTCNLKLAMIRPRVPLGLPKVKIKFFYNFLSHFYEPLVSQN